VQEELSSPGVVTLTHLASRAKPVNGFYAAQNRIMETISDLRRSSAGDKTARNTFAVANHVNFAVALASLQHSARD
jgi:hypothetical protein